MLVLAVIVISPSISIANEIYVNQSGDNLDLEAKQVSEDNYISTTLTGNNNNIIMRQGVHDTDTIDLDETGGHEAYLTVTGSGNTAESYQTDTNRSGGGGDSHHLANIIDGENNNIWHRQRGKAGHDGFIEITGDDNTVDLDQKGSGGKKWANIELTGNGHSVDVNQRGTNYASTNIELTNSGGAYDFTLSQNVHTSPDSYSITGYCYNSSGCAITVNRNN